MRRALPLLLLPAVLLSLFVPLPAPALAAPTSCSTSGKTLILWNSYPADGAYSFTPPESDCIAFVPTSGGVTYSISTVEGNFDYTGSVAVLRTGVVGLITTSVAVDIYQVLDTPTATTGATATPDTSLCVTDPTYNYSSGYAWTLVAGPIHHVFALTDTGLGAGVNVYSSSIVANGIAIGIFNFSSNQSGNSSYVQSFEGSTLSISNHMAGFSSPGWMYAGGNQPVVNAYHYPASDTGDVTVADFCIWRLDPAVTPTVTQTPTATVLATNTPVTTRTATPTPTVALPGVPAGCAVVNLTVGGSSQPLTVLPGPYSIRASWQFTNPSSPPFFALSSGQSTFLVSSSTHRFTSAATFYGAGVALLNWSITSTYESLLGDAVRVDVCPTGVVGTVTPSATPTGTIFPIGTLTPSATPTGSATATSTRTPTPSASPTAGGGPSPLPTAPIDCPVGLTPSPILIAPLPDLAILLPTLRTLPTSSITATVTFSATAIIGAVATIQAGMQTPVAAMQTATSGYSWSAGATIATSWTTTMQPALDWLALLNPSNAAWAVAGGPLWALAPILLPLSPIIIIGLIIIFARFFLWFSDRLMKLVDLVIKLIELIPGE